jgi:uncharacterized protein YdaU (DUF1376 family)
MSNQKAPAFQFYAADFYMDTISWTDEMVGLHIRLLCQQWINDKIVGDEEGYPVNLTIEQRVVFDKIKHKYFMEKNGDLKNKKLDKIKKNRNEFIKKASKHGTAGAIKRWGTPLKPHKGIDSESMALQSSSSSSINSIAGAHDKDKIIEYLRSATSREFISDEQIESEATEFKKRYDGQRIGNLKTLCNTWAGNIRPWQKQDKKLSTYI